MNKKPNSKKTKKPIFVLSEDGVKVYLARLYNKLLEGESLSKTQLEYVLKPTEAFINNQDPKELLGCKKPKGRPHEYSRNQKIHVLKEILVSLEGCKVEKAIKYLVDAGLGSEDNIHEIIYKNPYKTSLEQDAKNDLEGYRNLKNSDYERYKFIVTSLIPSYQF